jgi:hypothetical protein
MRRLPKSGRPSESIPSLETAYTNNGAKTKVIVLKSLINT